jgi:hypothetical protein
MGKPVEGDVVVLPFPQTNLQTVKLPEENPTIGLLLCKSAKKTVVELTLPKDANIHAKEYQLYLPSKELLKQKLDEWSAQCSLIVARSMAFCRWQQTFLSR